MYIVIFKWTKIVTEEFRISENSFMDKMTKWSELFTNSEV